MIAHELDSNPLEHWGLIPCGHMALHSTVIRYVTPEQTDWAEVNAC